MLEAALDRITALLGRAFLIGSFVPMVLFVGVSISTALLIDFDRFAHFWSAAEKRPAASGLVALLILASSAYVLMIVNPVFKRMLEGSYSIAWLSDHMRKRKRREFACRRNKLHRALNDLGQIREERKAWEKALVQANQARSEGQLLTGAEAEKLSQVESELQVLVESGKVLDLPTLRPIYDQILHLYQAECDPEQLEALHWQFLELVSDTHRIAESIYARSLADLQSRFAVSGQSADVQSTRIGNIMAASWAYSYNRYGVDAAFMWSRLQKGIPDTYSRIVEDGRIAFDSCSAMTGLSLLYGLGTLAWQILSIPPGIISWQLGIPLVGFGLAYIFYFAAVEAARAFGSTLRTSFDLFRFELLEDLHLELPTTLKDEKQLWRRVNDIFVYGDTSTDITYSHPGKKSPPPKKSTRGENLLTLLRDLIS